MAPSQDALQTASEDSALMALLKSGSETALAELMQRWELPVKSVIARIVLNASEAEDLAQETFVRLWQHRDRYEEGRPVKPWILGIAINLARNRLRWWKRRPTVALEEWTDLPESDIAIGAGGLEKTERAQAVREAIASLPVEFREALVLFQYEHLSYADIALAVGTSEKAVENRIVRARERLRARLKDLAQSR